MKKIILTSLVCLFGALSVCAAYDPITNVGTVGNTLITKNALPSVTFSVVDVETSNGDITTTKKMYITKDKLSYTGNNNEVAAVIAGEMGAIVNAAASKKEFASNVANSILANVASDKLQNAATIAQQYALNNLSEKEQMNADITGVDLMIRAGYNPLAMIVVLGKMQGSVTDALKGQPNNFKRTMNIYDYLSYNYPEQVKAGYACNEYRTFVEFIQPTINKRNADKKALAKFQKEQAKAKAERAKQYLRYKATGGINPWDVTKSLLENKIK